MASIRARTNSKGVTSYAVLFLHGTKQRSKTFTSEKQATKFRKLVEAVGPDEALKKLEGGIQDNSPSVADLFDEWLALKAADMTTEGHRDYVRGYKRWIEPTFGWRDADTVTEKDIQAWVDGVLRPTLGAKAVAKQHALLHGMYKWAASKTVGKVPHDPCQETKLPKRTKKPPRGILMPELHALLQAGEKSELRDAADVIAVVAGTGWRPGEVMGLRCGAVEVMHNGAVYATVESVYRRGEGVVEDAKTEAGMRRLRVLGEGARVLARRIIGRGPADLVFPHPNPGRGRGAEKDEHGRIVEKPWRPANFTRNYWPQIVEAAGLSARKPTPYSLRHTHVALCHAAGLSLPEIQRRIGHESIQTTIDVYGKLIDGMTDEAADRLDALLNPSTAIPQTIAGELA